MEKKLIVHGKNETVDDIVEDIMSELFDEDVAESEETE